MGGCGTGLGAQRVWISQLSVERWDEPGRWVRFLLAAQEALGVNLSHVDTNDPVRRRAASVEEAAEYICHFGEQEELRWVFLKFGRAASCTIHYSKVADRWPNYVTWTLDSRKCSNDVCKNLFSATNEYLDPFYAFIDLREWVVRKRKPSGAINVEVELVGMFWITYFGAAYTRFFGADRLSKVAELHHDGKGGTYVSLGSDPASVGSTVRQGAEGLLGNDHFWCGDENLPKVPGLFALTLKQLKDFKLAT